MTYFLLSGLGLDRFFWILRYHVDEKIFTLLVFLPEKRPLFEALAASPVASLKLFLFTLGSFSFFTSLCYSLSFKKMFSYQIL